jgi:hypothetical protein
MDRSTLPRLRALEVARRCVTFNARAATIAQVSGLGLRDIAAQFSDLPRRTGGRFPEKPDYWYFCGRLSRRVEASIFLAQYRQIVTLGFTAQEALLSGYGRYLATMATQPSLTFERAFSLVGHLDGLWGVEQPTLALEHCNRCGSWHVVSRGDTRAGRDCVFCRLAARYGADPILRARFPDTVPAREGLGAVLHH